MCLPYSRERKNVTQYTTIRMAELRTQITPNADKNVEQREFSFTVNGNGHLGR